MKKLQTFVIIILSLASIKFIQCNDIIIIIPDVSKIENTNAFKKNNRIFVDEKNHTLIKTMKRTEPNKKILLYQSKHLIKSLTEAPLISEALRLSSTLIKQRLDNQKSTIKVIAIGMGNILVNVTSWLLDIVDHFNIEKREKSRLSKKIESYTIEELKKKLNQKNKLTFPQLLLHARRTIFPTIEEKFNIVSLEKAIKRNSKDLQLKRCSTGYIFLKSLGDMNTQQPTFINQLITIKTPLETTLSQAPFYYKQNFNSVIGHVYNLWSDNQKLESYFGKHRAVNNHIVSLNIQPNTTPWCNCLPFTNRCISEKQIEEKLGKKILQLIKKKKSSTVTLEF